MSAREAATEGGREHAARLRAAALARAKGAAGRLPETLVEVEGVVVAHTRRTELR